MKNIMVFKLFTLVLVSFLFNFNAIAENGEQSKKFGDYTVYYNTFNSSVLAANIAKQYGITRGNSTGVINIAVHKGNDDESAAVDAFLSGSIKNRDKLTFDINITPKSEKLGFNFKFQNQFYTD